VPDRRRVLPAQAGMLMNSLRFPHDGVDVVQVTLDWPEDLAREPLEAAWRAAARRHPVLRTSFHLDGADGLVQTVEPDADLDIRRLGGGADPVRTVEPDRYEDFLRADRIEGFALGAPPVRLTVLDARRVVLTFHHALLDGASLRALVEEVSADCAARRAGRAADLPDRPDPQRHAEWSDSLDQTAAALFWSAYLSGLTPPRPLPGHLGRIGAARADAHTCDLVLTEADSARIRQAARELGLRSSSMVSAAWGYLRARYGGVQDAVVAVTRSCRSGSVPGADEMIGMFINNVPLRVRFDDATTARALLADVDAGIAALHEHRFAPMASILAWAGLPGDGDQIDTMLMYDRRRLHSAVAGAPGRPAAARLDRLPPYAASLVVFDEPELFLSLVTDRRCFVPGSAERMLEQLRGVLIAFARDPDARLADLVIDGEAAVIAAWNRTPHGYPREGTVPGLFAAHAAARPDAPAVLAQGVAWTYAELDRRSAAVARRLRRRGVGTDTPVAVALPRSADLIAVLLGILRAGGAYVPIDLSSPAPRVASMTRGVRLAVIDAASAGLIPPEVPTVEVGELTAPGPDDGADDPGADPQDAAHPLSLAYITHTSGSTGVPKGVAVPHRGVVRLVSGPNFVSLGPGDRVLFLAAPAFDASTLEIWGPLLNGAAVVVAPGGPLGVAEIARLLREKDVTVAWLTAGLFHQVADADPAALAGLRWFLAGGEALNPDAVRTVLAVRGGKPVVNGYGPTENTTFTACAVLTDPDRIGPSVPIGRPVQHTTVSILSPEGRAVPIGVPGELCTGGAGLARGYAADPRATARAFVPDPDGGGRLYRTGDLARWRADGTLEFIGRLDDQVKIRGLRVEPGEVEAVLRTAPGVGEVFVTVRGAGEQRHLVAYATPAPGLTADAVRVPTLREHAVQRLPAYLVPTRFAVLDRLPLTLAGKIDRAALPEPGSDQTPSEAAAPPQGPVERRLAGIWQALLPDARFGRNDGFFALGGNSLTAARLMFRVREAFGVDIPLGAFYAAPTLAAAAAAIAAAAPAGPRIGRRSRDAYRLPDAAPQPADRAAPRGTDRVGRE
jgi:amino acid adenylation domain-containing protein